MEGARSGLWAPSGIQSLQSGMHDVESRIQTVLVISMKKGKRLKIPSSEDYRNPRLSLITLYGATYFLSIQPADLECFRGVSTIYHSLFG